MFQVKWPRIEMLRLLKYCVKNWEHTIFVESVLKNKSDTQFRKIYRYALNKKERKNNSNDAHAGQKK